MLIVSRARLLRIPLLCAIVCLLPAAGFAQQSGHSKRWVDSMKNLLYPLREKHPEFYRDQGNILRYIQVNAALGDHYMQRYRQGDKPALYMAIHYYRPTTELTEGTDSDLGDGDYATIRKRDSVCRQVARLCQAGLWPADSGWSPYVGRYINPDRLNAGNHWRGLSSDTAIAKLKFLPYVLALSTDAKAALDEMVPLLVADTNRRVVLIGGGGWSYITMQISWEQVNATMSYLTEQHGIPRRRFIFQYQGEHHKVHPNTVVIRYAVEGEYGPCNVAPPCPYFTKPR